MFGLNEAAMLKMSTMYVRKEAMIAHSVPAGMDLAGFFKSPDRLAPSMMPVTAGKITENTCVKLHGRYVFCPVVGDVTAGHAARFLVLGYGQSMLVGMGQLSSKKLFVALKVENPYTGYTMTRTPQSEIRTSVATSTPVHHAIRQQDYVPYHTTSSSE